MARALILVLDSFGLGATPDAQRFGDVGANTLGHIAEYRQQQGQALRLPELNRLGLAHAYQAIHQQPPASVSLPASVAGSYGACAELSLGKDTPSGHWEMAGLPVLFEWGYFPPQYPSFPEPLIAQLIDRAALPGVLGNCHASGTTIIEQLGEEHRRSGKPIVYTSADSVFQIAAHEDDFGLERLYQVCGIARELVDEYRIGRVIARPFVGEPGSFQRTGNRRDYATPPHADTLLDQLQAAGREVLAVGKISDIFAARGISRKFKAHGTAELFAATLEAHKDAPDGSLIFTNFVNFDSDFGHRRNLSGYAAELETFDALLPQLLQRMADDDLLIITADHGCDPSWPGSDHTREYVPMLVYGRNLRPMALGLRESMADIGQTVADYLSISPLDHGASVLPLLTAA
ncbi:MAG: phosphopentomutase [Wenzhouxiangellaceae bacterium]